jgi:hypothetical protein
MILKKIKGYILIEFNSFCLKKYINIYILYLEEGFQNWHASSLKI